MAVYNPGSGSPQKLTEIPFRLMIESVQDYAIFMLDPDGYIISWNIGAERLKGYTAAEAIGMHFSNFYSEKDRARKHPEYELDIAIKTGRYEEEGWRYRKDGTRFWANVVITAVRNEAGELIGFGKVTRDLTERKLREESERALQIEQAARSAAEAANRAKSEFLTTMSHELRTPLNAILGYIDLLELGVQGPLTEAQIASLDRVRRSSKHLLGLINDVLNFTRLDGGTIEYHLENVDANDLLQEVEPLVAPQFLAHNVAFTSIPCREAAIAYCDRDKTQQILLNLLTNAYKYTSAGGRVELACQLIPDAVQFTVSDNGRGIPPDRMDEIFEPFVQIDRHLNTDSQQGVGLGLSISRNLARDMHGDLTVQSTVGIGTRFTLELPRTASAVARER